MEKKVMVSIIMPVYNSAEYLDAAISSVLKQEYRDYELILIDDGSTDESGHICDRYSNKNKQIKVIHKKNGGLCSARNTGLKNALGKYLAFLDNDDEYLPGILKENIELLGKYDADLIRFDRIRRTYVTDVNMVEDRLGTLGIANEKEEIYDSNKIASNLEKIRKSGSFYTIWNGIFKRSIIIENNIKFDERLKFGGEDWTFNFDYLKYVKKMVFNPHPYYIYMRRYSHSVSTRFNENRLLGMDISCYAEKGYLKASGLAKDEKQVIATTTNYIYSIIDIMCLPVCNWKTKQKVQYLNDLRKSDLYKSNVENPRDLEFLKKDGRIKYIIMKNFYFGKNWKSIFYFNLRNKVFKKGAI